MAPIQYSQENRLISLATPLGTDVLLLRDVIHKEELGRPYEMTLNVESTNGNIEPNKILGQSVTVTINSVAGSPRYLNGIVSKFTQTVSASKKELYGYRLEVVPWISMLKMTSDCKAFQSQTIPQILTAVFKNFGFNDYELNLHHNYVPREFCIQYRESSFNFVHRLMEFAGITYFYRHAEGVHTLVLCDESPQYQSFPGVDSIPYNPEINPDMMEAITSWSLSAELSTSSVELNDYDYSTPKTNLIGKSGSGESKHLQHNYQFFDYPGNYQNQDLPDFWATNKLKQLTLRETTVKGTASFAGISAGYKFTLSGFPRTDQNTSHLTISALLKITSPPFFAAAGAVMETQYLTEFEAIPAPARYCNPCITPKPFIRGVQTAVVTGPSGQAVTTPYVSAYGSVVVQFRWDRYGQNDQSSSIYIRVAQPSAGNAWGSMFIPRIGNEVVVAFEEGDPDRPLIIGSVYNALQMPKLPLPANNLISYISDDGGNIIALDPTQNQQSVIIYSPYKTTSKAIGYTYGNITYS
jgi:type VI secretion system secreted protein VgrG